MIYYTRICSWAPPPTSTKRHSCDTCRCSQALLNHTYGSSVHHCHQCSLGAPHHNGIRMRYTVHYRTSTDSWHMLQKSSYVTCSSHFQEFRKKSYNNTIPIVQDTYGSSVHHCHQCSLGSPHHNGRRMRYTVHYCTSTESWYMLQKSSYVTCSSHFQEFILIKKKSYMKGLGTRVG